MLMRPCDRLKTNFVREMRNCFAEKIWLECTASKGAGNEFVLGEQSPMTDIIHPTLLGG